MRSKVRAGVTGGLIAGVVFGLMMQFSTTPTPDGREVPTMLMIAQVVRSSSIVIGWLYHLFNSAVIGGLFGALLGTKLHSTGGGLLWGALYGAFWWVLGGLILMPVLLGMPAFISLRDPSMRSVALGGLLSHLVFGAILGVTSFLLMRKRLETRLSPT